MGKKEIASPLTSKMSRARNDGNVFAVILVGGKGKRLRPLSTDARPKAFLSIMRDGRSMFKATVDRLKKIIPQENILVSANKIHLELVKKDFPQINKKNLILEPVSRNTAPAIGLAAAALKKRFSPEGRRDAVMVVVPSDQYVIDEAQYIDALKKAVEFTRNNDCLVVLGLKPTEPSTEFGYVKVKGQGMKFAEQISRVKGIYKVARFVEKPDLATAKRIVKDTRYFWNAGAFVFSANSILRALGEYAPDIFSTLMRIDGGNVNDLYRRFPDISIDYAVMEKANNIYCVKGAYRWRDIGSFGALREVLKRESRSFVEKNGKILRIL